MCSYLCFTFKNKQTKRPVCIFVQLYAAQVWKEAQTHKNNSILIVTFPHCMTFKKLFILKLLLLISTMISDISNLASSSLFSSDSIFHLIQWLIICSFLKNDSFSFLRPHLPVFSLPLLHLLSLWMVLLHLTYKFWRAQGSPLCWCPCF